MENYHIFEMTHAQDGLGIVPDTSVLIQKKKLQRSNAIFSGTFEECQGQKRIFIKYPKLLDALREEKAKQEAKEINKLIKKHR